MQSLGAQYSRNSFPTLVSHTTWLPRPAGRGIPALPVDADGTEVQDAGGTHHDIQRDENIAANAAEVPDSTCHLGGRDRLSVFPTRDPVSSVVLPGLPCTCGHTLPVVGTVVAKGRQTLGDCWAVQDGHPMKDKFAEC